MFPMSDGSVGIKNKKFILQYLHRVFINYGITGAFTPANSFHGPVMKQDFQMS